MKPGEAGERWGEMRPARVGWGGHLWLAVGVGTNGPGTTWRYRKALGEASECQSLLPLHPRVTLGKSPDLSGPSFAHCDLTRLTSVAFWDTSSTEGAPESHMWSAKPIPT